MLQAPGSVVLVRPHRFAPNPATAQDNGFQRQATRPAPNIATRAREEVDALAVTLRDAGISTEIFDDEGSATPDSVFPNNWFSTHPDGTVVLYPMYAPNRRRERREDVIDYLAARFRVDRLLDYTEAEGRGAFLEGTGVMVLDHVHRLAYACRSKRLAPSLLEQFCRDTGYTPVLFDATDNTGMPVYHTNVMMSVGSRIALIGSSMIRDLGQRERVLAMLRDSGRTVVELSEQQIGRFAGNCLELSGGQGQHLLLSATAAGSLTVDQRQVLQEHVNLLRADVSTIELAGGSVRCMIAGNHLAPKPDPAQSVYNQGSFDQSPYQVKWPPTSVAETGMLRSPSLSHA